MEQKQRERILKQLEQVEYQEEVNRIVRILTHGPRHGISQYDILCAYEGTIVSSMLSNISGDLWEKTYIDFHERQDEEEDYNLICERYDWLIKFVKLTEQYEGEPDIKRDIQYSLNALESAITEHKKVTSDQEVSG